MGKILEFLKRFGQSPTPAPTGKAQRDLGLDQFINDEAFDFFNALSGTLEVELTTPAAPIGSLSNLAAPPEAKLVSVRLTPEVCDDETDEPRPLTEEELDLVVFRLPTIRLRGESGAIVSHSAPDGESFTVRDLLRAVEDTERETRGDSQWLGGIDVHHCFFEGISQDEEGVWEINWGS